MGAVNSFYSFLCHHQVVLVGIGNLNVPEHIFIVLLYNKQGLCYQDQHEDQ